MDRFRLARKSEGWQADSCLKKLQFQKEGTMRRREFLASMGTAAAISSTSHAFAQPGGGSPQKVNVANYVALEAKPGEEEAVAEFLRQGKAWVEAEPATIAWFSVRLGPQPSPFSTRFPMKQVGKRI
jgi:hypothetical protein